VIDSLLRNPLAQWGLGQTRRDKRSLVLIIVFLVGFYGIAALIFINWASRRRRLEYLADGWGTLAAVVVGMLLLLWAPARVATAIAKQREEGVLDMLRLTGMSGSDLAVGHLLTQMSLPLTMAALTTPLVLAGAFSEAGPIGTMRLTIAMILLTPVYCMVGALTGLTVKKPQTAGGAGMFAAIVLLIASGVAITLGQELREVRILSFLGPWGPMAAWDRETNFMIQSLGVGLPGDLLQIAFLVVLSTALLKAVAHRYTSPDAVFFGRRGALLILFSLCALALATWYPDPYPSTTHRWRRNFMDQPAALAFHLIVPFVALLWCAIETPLSARNFIRGKARRDADDSLLPEERLIMSRFATPAIIFGLATLLFFVPMGIGASELSNRPGIWEISPAGLVLAGAIAVAAYALLSLTVQWAILATRDIGVPRLLAGMAVMAFWVLPVIGGAILNENGAPDEVASLAYGLNPFFGITAAAHAGVAKPLVGFDSGGLALYCLAVQSFAAMGVFTALKTQRERLEDHANSLVVLPADAYAAPGTLTQRCEQGHLFTDIWDSCPHCEPSATRADRRQEAAPPDPAAPPSEAQTVPTRVHPSEAPTGALRPGAEPPSPPEPPSSPEPASPADAPIEVSQKPLDPLAAAIQRSSLGSKRAAELDEDDDFITTPVD
jgi:ABC-2 family transporter